MTELYINYSLLYEGMWDKLVWLYIQSAMTGNRWPLAGLYTMCSWKQWGRGLYPSTLNISMLDFHLFSIVG